MPKSGSYFYPGVHKPNSSYPNVALRDVASAPSAAEITKIFASGSSVYFINESGDIINLSGSAVGGLGVSGTLSDGTANQLARYTGTNIVSSTPRLLDDGTDIVFSGTLVIASGTIFSASHLELKLESTGNLERPTPTSVGYFMRPTIPTSSLASEVSAIYIRAEHSPNDQETDFIYGLYGEIVEGQSLVGGSMTKVIHRGLGDAHYVALFNPSGGFGYEAAMFDDYENGFIATYQGSGGFQESEPNQPNCVGFQALQSDDGVNPGFVPSAGLFLANNSTGNSFTVRASTFADPGQVQFRVADSNYDNRWSVFTSGEQHMIAVTASSGDTLKNSPQFVLRGNYYNSSSGSSYPVQAALIAESTADAGAKLRINLGEPGSETLSLYVNTSSVDMQNHDIETVDKLGFVSGNVGIDLQTTSISNAGNITFFDGNKLLDLQNSDIVNTGKITMQTAGNGIDMQTSPITQAGNISLYNSTYHVDLQNGQILNTGKVTMQNGGNGIDMQSTAIANGGSITLTSGSATIDMQVNNITQLANLQFFGDGNEDIGQAADVRPRSVYVAKSVVVGSGGAAAIQANESDLVLSSSLGSNIVMSGTLMMLGGESNKAVRTVTSNYSATNNDYAVLIDATSNDVSVTLPSILHGQRMEIKRLDSAINEALISGTAGQTIDGASVQSLASQYDSISVLASGTNWYII